MSGRPPYDAPRLRVSACGHGLGQSRILAWRLSSTLTNDFCMEAVQEAVTYYGVPNFFNNDQGCQCTSLAFTGILKAHGIQINMDGTGCWRDNVFLGDAGRASNTRRSICKPTRPSARPNRDWPAT